MAYAAHNGALPGAFLAQANLLTGDILRQMHFFAQAVLTDIIRDLALGNREPGRCEQVPDEPRGGDAT